MTLTCEQIAGRRFRPLFGREWTPEQLEAEVVPAGGGAHGGAHEEVQRRPDGEHFTLYWQEAGLRFAAGLRQGALIYVSMSCDPGQLAIGEVFACLGAPDRYQAWCEVYPTYSVSSVHAALVFRERSEQMATAYAAQHLSYTLESQPAIDDGMPVTLLAFFGRQWAEDERAPARERPWPGSWQGVEIDVTRHDAGAAGDFETEDDGGRSAAGAASSAAAC